MPLPSSSLNGRRQTPATRDRIWNLFDKPLNWCGDYDDDDDDADMVVMVVVI